jgi:DNA-binding CsgD family transcriptional regulator
MVDERQGLVALARISGFMHGLEPDTYALGDEPVVAGNGPGARMLAADLAWEVLIAGTDRARAVRLARFALGDGGLLHHDSGLLWVVAAVVQDMAEEGGVDVWDSALAEAHTNGSVMTALAAHLWRGHLLWQQGNLREAYESFLLSGEQSQAWGSEIGRPYDAAFSVGVLLDRGDVVAARARLEENRGHPWVGDGLRLFADAEASVLMAEGRHADALVVLDRAGSLMTNVVNPVWRPWRSLRARAFAGLGRTGDAVTLLEEELVLARTWGAPRLVGRTLRLLGEARGAGSSGASTLREAVSVLESSDARLELGRALVALAPPRNSPAEAVPMMTRAFELARSCDAPPLREAAAARLRVAGVDLPLDSGKSVLLTGTERRITEMFLSGAHDRQIAQTLFLTPGSVHMTLESVRDRLGAGTTEELRAALARGDAAYGVALRAGPSAAHT